MSGTPAAVLLAALAGEARSARPLQRAGLAEVRRCAPGAGAAAAAAGSPPDARLLISWGCAGGLHPTLAPGDLLLPRTVVDRCGQCFTADPDLHARLATVLGTLRPWHGAIAEAGGIVTDARARRALARRTGGIAVDMESAAIARVAAAGGRPFVVIRAVGDRATLPLDRLPALDTGPARLLLGTLGRRGGLPVLCRLALAYRRALRTLERAAAILAAAPAGPLTAGPVEPREPAARGS